MRSNKKKIFACSIVLSLPLFACLTPLQAMEQRASASDFFRQSGKLKFTVEETIADNCQDRDAAISLLKSAPLTSVEIEKGVGLAFSTTAPWCLLTAKYIKSLKYRPILGDWGCGHGFFSTHALLSGANPYAIDSSLAAANITNKHICEARKHLPPGLNIKDLYRAANTSVLKPSARFMYLTKDINVAFNVIHCLSPSEADLLLTNLFENTRDNGIAIINCDTPFDQNNIQNVYYNQRKEMGLKYPGYGVYNFSSVVFFSSPEISNLLCLSVGRITEEEQESKRKKMGKMYRGSYPFISDYHNGQTTMVTNSNSEASLLAECNESYYYATGHQLFNKFDYAGLKNVMELAGFTVLNGWYTDDNSDTLYPHDSEEVDTIRASKLVVVAQKIVQ